MDVWVEAKRWPLDGCTVQMVFASGRRSCILTFGAAPKWCSSRETISKGKSSFMSMGPVKACQ